MVISYYGALNAFLAIYDLIPWPIKSFIIAAWLINGGISVINRVSDL